MLPEFLVETIKHPSDGSRIRVIRDDIVPGGSKQRALEEMLRPGSTYIYPAPAYGYAQIALALAAQTVGAHAVIFVAKRKGALHPRTQRAKVAGAKIIQVPFGMMTVVAKRARDFSVKHGGHGLIKGFDSPEFIETMSGVISNDKVMRRLNPERIWCCVGTGAIARALQEVWPSAKFCVVRTGMQPTLGKNMKLYTAPEMYSKEAYIKPPFPSCSNSDAKVWRFILRDGRDGDVFWNVAG